MAIHIVVGLTQAAAVATLAHAITTARSSEAIDPASLFIDDCSLIVLLTIAAATISIIAIST